MVTLEDQGQKIAEQLGHGVVYKGPWLPYGPGGEFYGHFFENDAVTESSFVASTLGEAREALTMIRKGFGAELPVFPGNPNGTCYEDAWRLLIKEEEGELIHGTVESLGRRIGHAWVELPTSFIWEPQSRRFIEKADFEAMAKPQEEARYSVTEAAIMLARVGKHGPWTKEEREQFLKRGNPAESGLEPWQMTKAEFEEWYKARFAAPDLQGHKMRVMRALEAGKPVPPEVLADYPDLQEKSNPEVKELIEYRVFDNETYRLIGTFTNKSGAEAHIAKSKEEGRVVEGLEKGVPCFGAYLKIPKPPAVGGNPGRVRFDRADIDSAIAAAKRLQSEKDLYIFATYLGYTIDSRPPPGMQQYVIVHPDSSTETVTPQIGKGGNPEVVLNRDRRLSRVSYNDAYQAWDVGVFIKEPKYGGGFTYGTRVLRRFFPTKDEAQAWVDGYMSLEYGEVSKEASNPSPGGNPIPEELDLARTLAIIDSRPKGRIIESKLREEFGDAVIDALRQGRYVVSGSAGYDPPLLVSLKGRELIQGGNPMRTEAQRKSFHERIFGKGSTPPLERLGRGQIANDLIPMPPEQGPPLPQGLGIRWPWRK